MVLDNLYIGSIYDLLHAPFVIYETVGGVQNCCADLMILDQISNIIHDHFKNATTSVLVHCGAGVERSPLAVIWYLHNWRSEDFSLEESFDLVKKQRPQIENRLSWIRKGKTRRSK